jgi:hypothetical protein
MWQQKQKATVGGRTLRVKGGSQNGGGGVQKKVESRRQNAAEGGRRQNTALDAEAESGRRQKVAEAEGGRSPLRAEKGRRKAAHCRKQEAEGRWRQKAECSRRQKTEKGRRCETEGGSVLVQAATLLWICMNLPRIGIL